MVVVQMLADEGVGLHGAVGVHLGHVHVVQEVHELLEVSWKDFQNDLEVEFDYMPPKASLLSLCGPLGNI